MADSAPHLGSEALALLAEFALGQPAFVRVKTGALADTLNWLEHGEADLLVVYHHLSISDRPQGRGFLQKTLQQDRLLPVARRQIHPGRAGPRQVDKPMPYLAYAPSLALSGLVRDHLQHNPPPMRLQKVLECDSADALLEYALKGMGVCWLPGSLVGNACRQGALAHRLHALQNCNFHATTQITSLLYSPSPPFVDEDQGGTAV